MSKVKRCSETSTIVVEVAYALPACQTVLEVEVSEGATLREAVLASGVLERYPEIDLLNTTVGVFSKIASWDDDLRQGDRIELYRPLVADPKQARRRRVTG